MEEIGLQLEVGQDAVIRAVRRYVSEGGRRLVEECPLRKGLVVPRTLRVPAGAGVPRRSTAQSEDPAQRPALSTLFEAYFDYFFRPQRRRSLLVGPTVGRWTGILWDEKAIDCRLLRFLSSELRCCAVGYCFVEGEEYSYIELSAGREVELFSSFLADSNGRNFWSANDSPPPEEGNWIADGFLKRRYAFIPGFYDLPFLRGKKPTFSCYHYSAFPDRYEEDDNYPLSAFRFFQFRTPSKQDPAQSP